MRSKAIQREKEKANANEKAKNTGREKVKGKARVKKSQAKTKWKMARKMVGMEKRAKKQSGKWEM